MSLPFSVAFTLLLSACAGSATAAALSSPVVDTGQTTCYDNNTSMSCPATGAAFFGQDAQHNGNMPSYTDNGDGTVSDRITGLIWQKSPDLNSDGKINVADKKTHTQATSYCDSLVLANQSDWRLPTIKELYSLIDFRGTDPSGYTGSTTSGLTPFIDTRYFDFGYGDTSAGERIIDAQFASSTPYVSTLVERSLFGVNFADGRIKGYGLQNGSKTFYVRCVRGNSAYGSNSFVDNHDGTITDQASGLMWTQNDSGSGMTWQAALAWVQTKNSATYLGHTDWRLPNAKELQGLIDYTRSPDTTASPTIDARFNSTGITNEAGRADYPYYWSSSTHVATGSVIGGAAVYLSFGRAMGYMNSTWVDVHGAGAQRSDPKYGNPGDYPFGRGPQGDAIRINNFVRLVRDATPVVSKRKAATSWLHLLLM